MVLLTSLTSLIQLNSTDFLCKISSQRECYTLAVEQVDNQLLGFLFSGPTRLLRLLTLCVQRAART